MKKRFIEHWMTRHGDIVTTEQNPCGCCPYDFLITSPYTKPATMSYSFGSRKEFKKYANSRGWEPLK